MRLVLVIMALAAIGICAGVSQADVAVPYVNSATTNSVPNIASFSSIACAPSTTTCIATAQSSNGDNPSEVVLINDGVPGDVVSVPDGMVPSSVACSSANSCVLVGDTGPYAATPEGALLPFAFDNGAVTFGSVEGVADTTDLKGVACPSISECVATGFETIPNPNYYETEGVLVDIPGGASGTPGTAQEVASVGTLGNISCNSASRCLAATYEGTLVLPVAVPGAIAGTPEGVTGIDGGIYGLSCVPGTTTCVAVGIGAGFVGVAVAITGTTEGTAETTPSPLLAVSCPTITFCVGVGGIRNPAQGYAVAFEPNTPIGTGTTDPNVPELQYVECQSAQSCLEIGATGYGSYTSDVDELPVTAPTATLSGTVTLAGKTPTDVTGAPVQACASDGSFCIDGMSGTAGAYSLAVPLGEAYVVTAFSPAGESYTEASSAATATVTASGLPGVGVTLEPAATLGSGVTVTSPDFGTEGSGTATPKVNWGQPFDVHIPASEFPSGETTTVETLVITGTNTSTGAVQSETVYAGGETTTATGQAAANGLVVGTGGVDIPVPALSPIHGPVSMVVNSFSVPIPAAGPAPPTGVAVAGADPMIFSQGTATERPTVVATDFGVDHTVGVPTISGPDADTFSLDSPTACAPTSTIVQQSAAEPGSDQSCSFSVTWTPPASVASTPQPYYLAKLNVPVTNSSGEQAELQLPLIGCDERVISADLCHQPLTTAATPIGSLYVDPSGVVETTTSGGTIVPLSGATVTLSELGSGGTYAAVPNGSDIMSPSNRVNPFTTGPDGGFGWDTLAGTYEITATDSAACPGSSATSAPETVPPPATGIVLMLTCPGITQSTTSTSLGADPGVAPPGQAVDLTATVTGSDPTGTVTLTYEGTTLATVPVNSSTGQASYTTSALPPGQDTITATYGGDSANASSAGQQTVTVQAATPVSTATAVTATPSTSTPGASVTYSATVTPASGAADPTGTVSFTATLGTSSTALCTAPLQGTTATCSSASAPVGADTIAAAYSGDTNFSASSGSTAETVSAPTATPPANAVTTSPAATAGGGAATAGGTPVAATGTVAPTGSATIIETLTDGNQRITLTTPSDSVCAASSAEVAGSLLSAAVKGSKAQALKFKSAGVYLDKGVKRSTRVKTRVKKHGKTVTATTTVITYTPNATLRSASDGFSLSLKGLAAGTHTLKVIITYSEAVKTRRNVKVDGKERTRTVTIDKTVTKSLSTPVKVC